MKLKKVTIEGFRGVPKTLEIALDGKSLCLLGENGHGKTTIVDALEYWSTGKLESFKGTDLGLDATINLDHGPPAVITCEPQNHATLRRQLSGSKAEKLEILGPMSLDRSVPPELPLLRHSTMTKFMSATPFDKRQGLLLLLGLEPLVTFRTAVVTSSNNARHAAEEAEKRETEEKQQLASLSGGKDVLRRAEELRKTTGLERPISSEKDLSQLEIGTTPAVQTRVDRVALVGDIKKALQGLSKDAVTGWNDLSDDAEAAAAEVVRTMLKAGERALALWTDRSCPLCLTPTDTSELAAKLAERAAELAELHQKLDAARKALRDHVAAEAQLAGAIKTLLESPPPEGWPKADGLDDLAAKLETHSRQAQEAVSKQAKCSDGPAVEIAEDLDGLRAAAVSAQESPEAASLAQLVTLRDTFNRVSAQRRQSRAKRKTADAMAAFNDLTEERVTKAVEDAIDRLGSVAADFYGRLIKNPVYSDVKLAQTSKRSGGIEFSLTFNKKHAVSPPRRVVSESQLNALGLAFFLAKLKVEATPWRTLVLDDIVNSFDANHRMGIAALLNQEFGDWQILFLTHDSVFVNISRQYFDGWRFRQIVGWSPTEGPVIDDEDPLKRLANRLEQGHSAAELGTLARFALERGLSTPLERLQLPIRFSRHGHYTGHDYRDALDRGLAERGASLKAVTPILERMRASNYLSNLSAHERQADPTLSTEDLHQMVADLEALAAAFICPTCTRPVWENQKTRDRDTFQCKCAKLAV